MVSTTYLTYQIQSFLSFTIVYKISFLSNIKHCYLTVNLTTFSKTYIILLFVHNKLRQWQSEYLWKTHLLLWNLYLCVLQMNIFIHSCELRLALLCYKTYEKGIHLHSCFLLMRNRSYWSMTQNTGMESESKT